MSLSGRHLGIALTIAALGGAVHPSAVTAAGAEDFQVVSLRATFSGRTPPLQELSQGQVFDVDLTGGDLSLLGRSRLTVGVELVDAIAAEFRLTHGAACDPFFGAWCLRSANGAGLFVLPFSLDVFVADITFDASVDTGFAGVLAAPLLEPGPRGNVTLRILILRPRSPSGDPIPERGADIFVELHGFVVMHRPSAQHE